MRAHSITDSPPAQQPASSSALNQFRLRWSAASDEAAIEAACASIAAPAARYGSVDPIAIAERHHAAVRVDPTMVSGLHGALSVVGGRWLIRVPAVLSPERRRFSIAHEIGHILLFDAVAQHPELVQQLASPELRPKVERLCNLAAAHILMPTEVVCDELQRWPGLQPSEALPALSTRFYVSYEAMARRIIEVDTGWYLVIWGYRTDHRRGPAWRTATGQPLGSGPYVPDGLSSSRLAPDLVAAAATNETGYAEADRVRFDSPYLNYFVTVRAWRSRRRAIVPLDSPPPSDTDEPYGKVFLLGRLP